ncbi:MAG: DUF1995 family protein [Cyanobacteriota bacterium]|nr:DUF1995 family protein [Cyanobacteriota bacterium]
MSEVSPAHLPQLPADLSEAQAQAMQAAQAAITAGYHRLQIEILAPDLKPEGLAWPFLPWLDPPATVFFGDAGAAALAQRDWGGLGIPAAIHVQGLSERSSLPPEQAALFVMPDLTSIEIVEKLCEGVSRYSERAVMLLNPQLQDVATVGVGLAGRRLRQRFLSTFEPCYYLRPLGSAALFRFYPHPWTVWQQTSEGSYRLLASQTDKPNGEDLARYLAPSGGGQARPLQALRRFIQALQR